MKRSKKANGKLGKACGGLLMLGLTAQVQAVRADYRTVDGYGNNETHPEWGAAQALLLRGVSGSHYADGLSEMAGSSRPSARAVSNQLCDQPADRPNPFGMSDFVWAWGQFIDHDLGLTEGVEEWAPIAVPLNDPYFDVFGTGTEVIPFRRAFYDSTTGVTSPREHVNEVTGFLDGSMVYGSDEVRAQWLREGVGGRLKVTPRASGDLLPYNDGTMLNAGPGEQPSFSTTLFVAGDIRANEQPVLASLHTLFVREHNRLAGWLASNEPGLSDEELYQRARRIVVGEIQRITYEEFLPALLGASAMPPYQGYSPEVNAGIATAFSTAAYRLGHTMINSLLLRLEENGTTHPAGHLSLRDAFFASTPELLESHGVEPLFRGLAAQRAQDVDLEVVDALRNFLFGEPGAGGLDLAALNVQRGRDMGLPDFNLLRGDYGLPLLSSFVEVTSDPAVQAVLGTLYGTVDDIDPFVGLLAEDDVHNSAVGPTLRAVLVDQFTRTRDGDRFWYQAVLTGRDRAEVMKTKLSDVIARNTNASVQKKAFQIPEGH